jgi:hypothetical protein
LRGSKFQMLGRAGEGDDIPDVSHSRDGHQEALKPQAKAGVRDGAEASNVEIPPVGLESHAQILHAAFEQLETFFALTAPDELAHPRNEQIHGRHGGVVIVDPHIKGFDGFGVVVHDDGLEERRLEIKSFTYIRILGQKVQRI